MLSRYSSKNPSTKGSENKDVLHLILAKVTDLSKVSCLENLRQYAVENGEAEVRSGRPEWSENIINRYI